MWYVKVWNKRKIVSALEQRSGQEKEPSTTLFLIDTQRLNPTQPRASASLGYQQSLVGSCDRCPTKGFLRRAPLWCSKIVPCQWTKERKTEVSQFFEPNGRSMYDRFDGAYDSGQDRERRVTYTWVRCHMLSAARCPQCVLNSWTFRVQVSNPKCVKPKHYYNRKFRKSPDEKGVPSFFSSYLFFLPLHPRWMSQC